MTLYLDTSSLIKLYVHESASEQVRSQVEASSTVVTSIVAYPEARSALARLRREGRLSARQLSTCRLALDRDWTTLVTIGLDAALYQWAGELAERHALRGFDSLHLASYLETRRRAAPAPVTFSCFDERLTRAALAASRAAARTRH